MTVFLVQTEIKNALPPNTDEIEYKKTQQVEPGEEFIDSNNNEVDGTDQIDSADTSESLKNDGEATNSLMEDGSTDNSLRPSASITSSVTTLNSIRMSEIGNQAEQPIIVPIELINNDEVKDDVTQIQPGMAKNFSTTTIGSERSDRSRTTRRSRKMSRRTADKLRKVLRMVYIDKTSLDIVFG